MTAQQVLKLASGSYEKTKGEDVNVRKILRDE